MTKKQTIGDGKYKTPSPNSLFLKLDSLMIAFRVRKGECNEHDGDTYISVGNFKCIVLS